MPSTRTHEVAIALVMLAVTSCRSPRSEPVGEDAGTLVAVDSGSAAVDASAPPADRPASRPADGPALPVPDGPPPATDGPSAPPPDGPAPGPADAAAASRVVWSRPLENAYARSMVVLDGNLYVVGSFSGEAQLGDQTVRSVGGFDGFVASYSAEGTLRWLKTYGGASNDAFNAIAVSGSQLLVAGTLEGLDRLEGKAIEPNSTVDSSGVFLWFDAAGKLARARYASFPLWLSVRGTRILAGGYTFSAQYELDGTAVNGTFSPIVNNTNAGVFDRDGNLVMTGGFPGAIDVGRFHLDSRGNFDIFVVKYDRNKNPLWVTTFPGKGADQGQAVAVDDNNDVLVSGDFGDDITFGNRTIQGVGGDAFIAKLSGSDGSLRWFKTYSSPANETIDSVALAPGAAYFGGWGAADLDLGGGLLETAGKGFVARIDPQTGAHVWSTATARPTHALVLTPSGLFAAGSAVSRLDP